MPPPAVPAIETLVRQLSARRGQSVRKAIRTVCSFLTNVTLIPGLECSRGSTIVRDQSSSWFQLSRRLAAWPHCRRVGICDPAADDAQDLAADRRLTVPDRRPQAMTRRPECARDAD